MIYYKILKKGKSCNGGDFDYCNYLPNGKKAGEWTPRITDVDKCRRGYHITPYWCMWFEKGCEVYEVEARGLLEDDSVGVIDKYVCEQIRFIKKIDAKIDDKNNSGDSNSGYRNSGDSNSGDSNSGDRNSGDRNSGDRNSGDRNSGHRNSGDSNSGHRNSGHSNSGYRNSGYRNSGDCNSGHRNSGDCNSGHRNSGYWNLSDHHTGCFNSLPPKVMYLFNKEITYDEYQQIDFPSWLYFDLLKDDDSKMSKSWRKAFDNATTDEIKDTTCLPNFDYNVFEEITGISKKMIEDKLTKDDEKL